MISTILRRWNDFIESGCCSIKIDRWWNDFGCNFRLMLYAEMKRTYVHDKVLNFLISFHLVLLEEKIWKRVSLKLLLSTAFVNPIFNFERVQPVCSERSGRRWLSSSHIYSKIPLIVGLTKHDNFSIELNKT